MGGIFNYCIRDSVRFLVPICLAIRCNYFVSFAALMTNYLLVLSLIILLNHVLFCCLIILQLATWRILNITSCPNNKCTGLTFSAVSYVLHIPYAAADSTPAHSKSKFSDYFITMVCTMFANVWCIISTIELAWGFSVVSFFTFRPYFFLNNYVSKSCPINSFTWSTVIFVGCG